MLSLIYRSEAAEGLTYDEIHDLMRNASRFNAQNEITGCLVYHRCHFIHMLEGEENMVRKLFGRISKDKRHNEIILLNLEENKFRLFSQFSTIYNNFCDESDQILHKKMLFHQVFHGSEIVKSPGSSKITLWAHVNKLLKKNTKLSFG